ncbi:hypothetical protein P3G55_00595 [Leptospira sp. 96542]|nr:hypothetical protein [Leptospira sp. 96542]
MNSLNTVFDFTEDDLNLNRLGKMSRSQLERIKSKVKIFFILGCALSFVFLFIAIYSFYLYFYEVGMYTKDGNIIPSDFFLFIAIGSLVLTLVMLRLFQNNYRIFLLSPNGESIKLIDSLKKDILYDSNGKSMLSTLKVKGISFNQTSIYHSDLFSEKNKYRFYYTERTKILLSVEVFEVTF